MSQATHTPGPWRYQPAAHDLIGPNVIALGNDNACGDPECCGPREYWIEIRSEDALLIAAAPDLLEVLREIVADGVHSDVVPHLHRKALEAIAKATGSAA